MSLPTHAAAATPPAAFSPTELAGAAAVVLVWGLNFLVVKVALIGALALREPVDRPLRRGMVFAAMRLGCFAVSVVRAGGADGVTLAGLLLTLCASSMWAGSNVVVRALQRDGRRYDPLALVFVVRGDRPART